MTRMRKNQEVTMFVLEKICDVLDADFGDIVEYMGSQQTNKQEVRCGAEK